MSKPEDIKRLVYLWAQLGKKVVFCGQEMAIPYRPAINEDIYPKEFEKVWEDLWAHKDKTYLLGLSLTLENIEDETWDITNCPRCPMPTVMKVSGYTDDLGCLCQDLGLLWPNTSIPSPALKTRGFRDIIRNLESLSRNQ